MAPDQRLYEGVKSPYAEVSFNTPVSYAVTKTAVLGLTRYLATYWGRKNIRVNALTPHGVFDNHDESFVHNFVYRSPLGRMARNDEYRGALLFEPVHSPIPCLRRTYPPPLPRQVGSSQPIAGNVVRQTSINCRGRDRCGRESRQPAKRQSECSVVAAVLCPLEHDSA